MREFVDPAGGGEAPLHLGCPSSAPGVPVLQDLSDCLPHCPTILDLTRLKQTLSGHLLNFPQWTPAFRAKAVARDHCDQSGHSVERGTIHLDGTRPWVNCRLQF